MRRSSGLSESDPNMPVSSIDEDAKIFTMVSENLVNNDCDVNDEDVDGPVQCYQTSNQGKCRQPSICDRSTKTEFST